uniref:Uncharacterized protein n=1 Tax=Panagrolaimus superbus TaxID=310955 RepID=A0A914YE82_9BILA
MYFTLFYLLIFFPFTSSTIIGKCNTDTLPPSWLSTAGHGINDWGTAGINLGGNNFCLVGNKSAEIVEVSYHINITQASNFETEILTTLDSGNLTNACLNQDPRIHYCQL